VSAVLLQAICVYRVCFLPERIQQQHNPIVWHFCFSAGDAISAYA